MPVAVIKRTQRLYDVVLCISAGKTVGAAMAVIENGKATFASGQFTWPMLRSYLNKYDAVVGIYQSELERQYTETNLLEAEENGCTTRLLRFYEPELNLKFPTRVEKAEWGLTQYLKALKIPTKKHKHPLIVNNLERLKIRTGEVIKREFHER